MIFTDPIEKNFEQNKLNGQFLGNLKQQKTKAIRNWRNSFFWLVLQSFINLSIQFRADYYHM